MPDPITLAVIGGSGLYALFDPAESEARRIRTPFGPADVTIGELAGRRTAFLTRHGVDHSVAPHLIEYRANIWALASLGVTAIISSAAVGGVSPDFPPGTLVLTDQFIDRTNGRADTFFDSGSVQHLAAADPFCPTLHRVAASALADAGETVAPGGTVVVIQGPRFSTRAESAWFRAAGAHTVNMTLYPEVVLASELNIGTVNLSFVTDSDAGLAPPTEPEGDSAARAASPQPDSAARADSPQADSAARADSPQADAAARAGSPQLGELRAGSPQPDAANGSQLLGSAARAVSPQPDAAHGSRPLGSAARAGSPQLWESGSNESLSAELVFRRLAAAQPRIVAAIETIARAIPDDYRGRQLIDPTAVAEVLAMPVHDHPAVGG